MLHEIYGSLTLSWHIKEILLALDEDRKKASDFLGPVLQYRSRKKFTSKKAALMWNDGFLANGDIILAPEVDSLLQDHPYWRSTLANLYADMFA